MEEGIPGACQAAGLPNQWTLGSVRELASKSKAESYRGLLTSISGLQRVYPSARTRSCTRTLKINAIKKNLTFSRGFE